MKIEIVVYNIESALNAQMGGADRIELCDNPCEGGTTPSAGVIELVRKKLSIEVFVMIRPRGGNFIYSDDEIEAMKRDIEFCKKLKVDGVVFGILTNDGRIDVERSQQLVQYARPLGVTCHRAFDMTRDVFEALNDCMEAGFDRILTSGRQPSAVEGSDLLVELVKKTNGKISIMPGAGVNEHNVQSLVNKTGVHEIHFSGKKFVKGSNQRFNSGIYFSESLPDDQGKWITDPEVVKKIREIVST